MRKYQIYQSDEAYAISDFGKNEINFATHKDFSLKFKKHDILETETALKPAFVNFLNPILTSHGVHPIFNFKGDACEQIVNVPNRVLSSEEILTYLNDYTILPQETPPWEEIIYKLACFSQELTDEFYEKEQKMLDMEDALTKYLRDEEDTDEHYFVTAPKISEEHRGFVFHLPKPTRAHRTWINLDEHYDYKKNAWIKEGCTEKRKHERIELADRVKPITQTEVEKAKTDYLNSGGKITCLNKEPESDWKSFEIHDLAKRIPVMRNNDRERLKEDIRVNGVHEALWIYEGKILEGRTRYGICLELGIRPKFKPYKSSIPAKLFVRSVNINRRHFTSSQLAAFGVEELLPEYEKEAKKRMENGGRQQIAQGENGSACIKVAELLKTNKQYIKDAKNIKEKYPDVFAKILAGDLTITKAKSQIKSSNLTLKKKRKPRSSFEKQYRLMLGIIIDRPSSKSYIAFHRISEIYISWNKRNEKKMLKSLEVLKDELPELFEEKKERHLTLLQM